LKAARNSVHGYQAGDHLLSHILKKFKKLQIFIGFLLISLNVIDSYMRHLISCPDNRLSRSRLISTPPASSSS